MSDMCMCGHDESCAVCAVSTAEMMAKHFPSVARTAPGVAARLVGDIAAGVRVLRTRDGANVSEDQVMDRARNIVCALIGNYDIVMEPGARRVDAAPRTQALQLHRDGGALRGPWSVESGSGEPGCTWHAVLLGCTSFDVATDAMRACAKYGIDAWRVVDANGTRVVAIHPGVAGSA